MSYVTRSQVYHNGLDDSIHRLTLEYKEESITYVFSSDYYKNIFMKKLEDHREKIKTSLTKRFGFEITNNMIADIKLYTLTEKRGFLIIGKEEHKCLNTIRLDGVNLILRN